MESRREGSRIFIRLELGDDVLETLTATAAEHGVTAGWLNGIGAASGVELGYYDLERKDYTKWEVAGDVEFASASGSIGLRDGKPFVHLHAVVSDRQCVTHGGHLFRATTGATLEFVLLVGEAPIERTPDDAIGLYLWRV
jgi:predicted DNA-binding protein with PD1-like motif